MNESDFLSVDRAGEYDFLSFDGGDRRSSDFVDNFESDLEVSDLLSLDFP